MLVWCDAAGAMQLALDEFFVLARPSGADLEQINTRASLCARAVSFPPLGPAHCDGLVTVHGIITGVEEMSAYTLHCPACDHRLASAVWASGDASCPVR